MNKLIFCCSFFLFQISNHTIAQNNVLSEKLPKKLYRISVGSHYFNNDILDVGEVIGFNVGIGYERTFARKWSWGLSLESFFNKNAVPKLKILNASYIRNNGEINLPEIEERYALSPEIRYYFTKAGQGFYLSNISNIQWVRNEFLTYFHDCMTCPNQNYLFDNYFTFSDRLTFGYQKSINQKLLVGVGIAYELRLGYYGYYLINSPQISFQIGFGK